MKFFRMYLLFILLITGLFAQDCPSNFIPIPNTDCVVKANRLKAFPITNVKGERRENDLNRIKSIESSANRSPNQLDKEFLIRQRYGTVGAVALDKHGNLAAGTSTGGMTNKKWNRIGDVPIIGAGTYANNSTCAISATGWGEFFIRNVVGHDISALMEYKNYSIEEAARIVIHDKVAALGGDGGVIGIDKDGNVVMEMNTSGMYRAHINSEGELTVEIYNN